MVLSDVSREILVGISCRTGEVRGLFLSVQLVPNFDAANSGRVEKGWELVIMVVGRPGWVWFAIKDAMVIMTLVSTPTGVAHSHSTGKICFVGTGWSSALWIVQNDQWECMVSFSMMRRYLPWYEMQRHVQSILISLRKKRKHRSNLYKLVIFSPWFSNQPFDKHHFDSRGETTVWENHFLNMSWQASTAPDHIAMK